MKISYISDLHFDFYVDLKAGWEAQSTALLQKLLPEDKGDVLIIAGDLSHFNEQSVFLLQFFSTHFAQILFVMGNHDYYVIEGEQHSAERAEDLQQQIKHLTNVTLLADFEVFMYEGVRFAGATNWYDLRKFAEQQFFLTMNDSKYITHFDIKIAHMIEQSRYADLQPVDVLITHVPTVRIFSHDYYGKSTCYLNELPELKATHYIFGHCHEQNVYEKYDCKFYINALGYPRQGLERSIKTFEL
ncbi:MAG: metallophosphoesterase [Solibacillus sp.]